MKEERFVSETSIRVRYAETDAMGIVHHSSYIIWFEAGRSEWMRQQGSSYASFEKTGYFLPLSEVGARFISPARYDDEVIVRTWIGELKSRKLRFDYEVVGLDGTTLCTGFTSHIVTDNTGRVTTWPPEVRRLLERGQGGNAG